MELTDIIIMKTETQNKTKHSPLPWQGGMMSGRTEDKIVCASGRTVALIFEQAEEGEQTANREYIVEACNNYERAKGMIQDACKMLSRCVGPEDAKFILEACNNYEKILSLNKELVAALEDYLTYFDDDRISSIEMKRWLDSKGIPKMRESLKHSKEILK